MSFDVPCDGVWFAIILQFPDILTELSLGAFGSVVEAGFVASISGLEGCGSKSDMGFFFFIRGVYCCFVDDVFCFTLSRQGALLFFSAVACIRCSVLVAVQDHTVVRFYGCFHVIHAAVTELYGISVTYFVELIIFWEVFVD